MDKILKSGRLGCFVDENQCALVRWGKSRQVKQSGSYKMHGYQLYADRLVQCSSSKLHRKRKIALYILQIRHVVRLDRSIFKVELMMGKKWTFCAADAPEADVWMHALLAVKKKALAIAGHLMLKEDEIPVEEMHTLTMVQVSCQVTEKKRISVMESFDTDVLLSSTVWELKCGMVQKLKLQNEKNDNEVSAWFRENKMEFLVLKMEDASQEIWLCEESIMMYETLKAHNMEIPRCIKLVLMKNMQIPPDNVLVSITTTCNRVSDLTHRLYTIYRIDLQLGNRSWAVHRRFNDFKALEENLHDYFSKPNSFCENLPTLRLKNTIKSTKARFIEKRRLALQEYLRELLQIDVVKAHVLLLSFIGLVSTSCNTNKSPQSTQECTIHINQLDQYLDFGDIVLIQSKFLAAKLQRKITRSFYDHVGIVVQGISDTSRGILEATGEGITVYTLKSRLLAYSREVAACIKVRKVTMLRTTKLAEISQRFVEQVEGKGYSLRGVLSKASKRTIDSRSKDEKFFCSELAAAYFVHLGVLNPGRANGSYWPGDFATGSNVDKHLANGFSIGPEICVDCRILEVSNARCTSNC